MSNENHQFVTKMSRVHSCQKRFLPAGLALATLLGDENGRSADDQPTNADLMTQLQEIKEEIQGIQQLRQKVDELTEENKQIKEDLRKVFEI